MILEKLALPYTSSLEIEATSLGVERPLKDRLQLTSWTTPDVWLTLRFLIYDQLGIKIRRIEELATFLDDLGCD
jgi:ribosome maturation factor RimP